MTNTSPESGRQSPRRQESRRAGKVLVTGGAGFIGTNLVEHLLRSGRDVLSIDVSPPRLAEHEAVFRRVDILDPPRLRAAMAEFDPDAVVHLAARTDLRETKDLDGYRANTAGTENVVRAAAGQATVKRCIFTSTKLVCRNGHWPASDEEYCPTTLYGRSKVLAEKIVRAWGHVKFDWCIVRPGSIWGPWFGEPYRRFFLMIARGRFFQVGSASAPKLFGYVGNTVHQLRKLLEAPPERIRGKVLYLSDYEPIVIRDWAEMIRLKLNAPRIHTMPEPLVRTAAMAGDLLEFLGWPNVPLTSFRLANLRTDTSGMPLDAIRALAPRLPFTLGEGVDETVAWLARMGLCGNSGPEARR